MPRMSAAEQDAIYTDIQTRFAAGESLTAIHAHYAGKFTLGELKQILRDQTKRGSATEGNTTAPAPMKPVRK